MSAGSITSLIYIIVFSKQQIENCRILRLPETSYLIYSDRVTVGRSMDLPVYFGDAGSREVRKEKEDAS